MKMHLLQKMIKNLQHVPMHAEPKGEHVEITSIKAPKGALDMSDPKEEKEEGDGLGIPEGALDEMDEMGKKKKPHGFMKHGK